MESKQWDEWSSSRRPAEFEGGFVQCYEDLAGPMVRLAYALTGSEALAQDLVHDVFLRAHARWSKVDHPRSYLRSAVVNACRSSSRRSKRERSAAPLFVVEDAELQPDELFDALEALPYRQRAALVLRFYEGLTHAEIAEVLRCREGTVASLVHRGLAQLRRVIEP
jgi:RNA polymerase sigma factor (sigma-70 family)